ncbi:MAG: hypothetical protein R2751_19045 [Bacteroidales bacterium]
MKLDRRDCPVILNEIRELARMCEYSKIFCSALLGGPYFFADGFRTEAIVPGFSGEGSGFSCPSFWTRIASSIKTIKPWGLWGM